MFTKTEQILWDNQQLLSVVYDQFASEDRFLYISYSDHTDFQIQDPQTILCQLPSHISTESKQILIDKLGNSTSLELCVKFISHTFSSVEDYFKEFEKYSSQCSIIESCLKIILHRIQDDHPQCECVFIILLVFLVPKDLSWEIIRVILDVSITQVQTYGRYLEKFGVISCDEIRKTFSISATMRTYLQLTLVENENWIRLVNRMTECFKNTLNCEILVPSAKQILKWPIEEPQGILAYLNLANQVAQSLYSIQNWKDSEKFYQRSFEIMKSIDEPDEELSKLSIQTLETLQELNTILGQFEQAREICVYRHSMLCENDREERLIAHIKDRLHLSFLAKHKISQEEIQEALAFVESSIGSENPDFAIFLALSAGFYLNQGDALTALDLLLRAEKLNETHAEPQRAEALIIRLMLGRIHCARFNYVEAKFILERVVLQYESFYGSDHPFMIFPLVTLADVCYRSAQYEKSKSLLDKLLQITEKTAPKHDTIPEATLLLGCICIDMAKFHEALSIFKSINISINWRFITCLIVKVLCAQGNYQEALHLLDKGYSIGVPEIGALKALIYSHFGEFDKAEMEIPSISLGDLSDVPVSAESGVILFCKSILLKEAERYPEALEVAMKALQLRESYCNYPNHPTLIEYLCNVALIYAVMANFPEALSVLNRAKQIGESNFGADFTENALALQLLGFVYLQMGNFPEALVYLERAKSLVRSDAYFLPELLLNFASVLFYCDKSSEAVPLFHQALQIFHSQGRNSPLLRHMKRLEVFLVEGSAKQ